MSELFDPDAPASASSGIFGLSSTAEESAVHVIGVPFDATASYGHGAWRGPEAILRASRQVDLFDLQTGTPYQAGIYMHPIDERLSQMNEQAARLAAGVHEAGGPIGPTLRSDAERVNDLCAEMNGIVHRAASEVLSAGKLPVVIGGDHSAPFGAIQACSERFPGMGVLHFDAHADLRKAYEGFEWSHASILFNATTRLEGIARVVQVGVRDLCEEEWNRIQNSGGRIATLFDSDWARRKLVREDPSHLIREWIERLPEEVYVTFDVDGLDPTLCPNTGTPVPGGLLWHEAMAWLEALSTSGRRVVGLDLNEVNPGPGSGGRDSIDSIVGARLLYRLIGTALKTRGL